MDKTEARVDYERETDAALVAYQAHLISRDELEHELSMIRREHDRRTED